VNPPIGTQLGRPVVDFRGMSLDSIDVRGSAPMSRLLKGCLSSARWLLELLAELLSPRLCPGCDEPVGAHRAMCAECCGELEPASGAEDGVAAFAYGGALRTAVHKLKYNKRPDLGGALGELLAEALVERIDRCDVVIPVPLHPLRLTTRGYNQAALLAAPLARALGAPLSVRVLARRTFLAAQARLNREARDANVRDAFVPFARADVRGKHVVVVDDVVTTGSTFAACRAALLLAGASRVTCVALARAERRMEAGASAVDGEARDQRDVIAETAEMAALPEGVRALEVEPADRR
jgi:ComF family protein